MTTEEGNKIIAEFMGWTIEKGMEQEANPYYNEDYKVGFIPRMIMLSDMQYHYSWDWLIPVYSKVATEWSGLSSKRQGEVKDIKRALQNRLVLAEINGVWQFCIQFIQWYKSNKKQ